MTKTKTKTYFVSIYGERRHIRFNIVDVLKYLRNTVNGETRIHSSGEK